MKYAGRAQVAERCFIRAGGVVWRRWSLKCDCVDCVLIHSRCTELIMLIVSFLRHSKINQQYLLESLYRIWSEARHCPTDT